MLKTSISLNNSLIIIFSILSIAYSINIEVFAEIFWTDSEFTAEKANLVSEQQIEKYNRDQLENNGNIIKIEPLEYMSKKYKLDHKFGQGAMGATYDGIDVLTGGKVAIKQQSFTESALKEVNSLERAKRNHCYDVVELYEVVYDREHNQLYIVMERIAGENFNNIVGQIKESKDNEQYLAKFKKIWKTEHEFIKTVVEPIIRGMRCLHNANIVHNDFKSDNVIYDKDKKVTKIIDLGLSFLMDAERPDLRRPWPMPGYPPELNYPNDYKNPPKADDKEVGIYKDIWSVGETLYQILFGKEEQVPEKYSDYKSVDLSSLPNDFKDIGIIIHSFMETDYHKRKEAWDNLKIDH